LKTFGWKSVAAILTSTAIFVMLMRSEIAKVRIEKRSSGLETPPVMVALHFAFLAAIVFFAHHPVIFMAALLFFIGVAIITKEYQSELEIRGALLVAFFLGGIVVLGGPQHWWLGPLLASLSETLMYFGSAGLTAVLDNAAITYLGSQVADLSELAKYALVAGSVTGGGLTVIANAPNPAGYGILNSSFGPSGISPLKLFIGALGPTLVAVFWLWVI
ncbi:MAG TPA: putative Na+/H+ antiporter, partial [Bdellovibrionales bacterium]|nr:putative Na+/H+ antiporter [Bdellovibrionales bacterium]